ncbi:Translation initiation factor eIF-2B subunit gamma [Spathaspora sp. JA1]|nr:Translation initiation factor eIF-2B subunit gamma [Spathaspora sp. JA1]
MIPSKAGKTKLYPIDMEFTAIIFCGQGKSLFPISSGVRSTGIPKALIPIGNRPMIEYVLDWCQLGFFPHVIVVSNDDDYDGIKDAVDNYQSARKNKKEGEESVEEDKEENVEDCMIEVVAINTDHSGPILFELYKNWFNKFMENFVILPCDFMTNLPPQVLIEAYRNRDDNDLGLLIQYKNQLNIEDKKNKIFPKHYTIYSQDDVEDKLTLLDIYNQQDIEFHKSLQIRTQMCWRYPNSVISTKLLNSSIFLGSTNIFDIFKENPNKFTQSYFKSRSMTKIIRDLARRSWKHSSIKQTIGILILPQQVEFLRCNNLSVLMEANRQLMKQQAKVKAQQQQVKQASKTEAHVGVDSLVGDNCTLGEKTNVKTTVIGKNCTIGKRVKLTGCLILNNVIIEDDVQLENCIIGNDVIIHSKCKLINCNVESTNEILKGTLAKGDTLVCLTLEGLQEGGTGVLESDESEAESSEEYSTDYDEEEYDDNDDGLFGY